MQSPYCLVSCGSTKNFRAVAGTVDVKPDEACKEICKLIFFESPYHHLTQLMSIFSRLYNCSKHDHLSVPNAGHYIPRTFEYSNESINMNIIIIVIQELYLRTLGIRKSYTVYAKALQPTPVGLGQWTRPVKHDSIVLRVAWEKS